MRLIKQALYISSLAQGKAPDTGEQQEAIAMSFAYALDDIPTHHLSDCFQRAIRRQTDDFHLTAAAVKREYEDMLPELQQQAREAEDTNALRLESGRLNFGYISIPAFKERHNLPPQWKLGDPYPPESDLYGKPPPPMPEQVYECQTCKGARLVKEYPRGPLYPKLIPCPYCGEPVKSTHR